MWSNKKPDTPKAADSEPTNLQTTQPTKVTPAFEQRTTKMNNNVIRPTGPTADRVMARLGSSLQVKGEISGNEDLYVDGTVEGLVHLNEGKLTVGATAKLTADVIAGEVIVYRSSRHSPAMKYVARLAMILLAGLFALAAPQTCVGQGGHGGEGGTGSGSHG